MHTRHLLVDLGILFLVDLVCSVGGSSVVELLFDHYDVAIGTHLACCGTHLACCGSSVDLVCSVGGSSHSVVN